MVLFSFYGSVYKTRKISKSQVPVSLVRDVLLPMLSDFLGILRKDHTVNCHLKDFHLSNEREYLEEYEILFTLA